MQTGRSVTSQAKKHPIVVSNKAPSKPSLNKIFSQVDSLHIQLIQSPPQQGEIEYFIHKIQEYRTKLMKTEPLKKTKKYFQKLQECETIINTQTSNHRPPSSYTASSKPTSTQNFSLSSPIQHTRTESGCQNSRYNSIEMDLLRSTVQSKQGLLKQLYQKQKLKVQTYQQVIKQQQREMNLVKDRLQEVEVNKSTSNIHSNMTHTIMSSENITLQSKERRHKSNYSKESQSKSYNKQNIQNNSNNQNISRLSNNSLIKELIIRNNQQSLSFQKTEKASRVSSKFQDNVSKTSSSGNSYESMLLKQQEDLIVSLQHENRILTTSKQTLEISLSNKDKSLKSKEKEIDGKNKQIKELKEQIRVKEEMLTELLYEKQNYSDAYAKLKQEAEQLRVMLKQSQELRQQSSSHSISQKSEQLFSNQQIRIKEQQLGELEDIIVQTKTELEEERERNEGLKVALQREEEKVRKLTQKWDDSEEENKEIKLKLRTMEHKMEMYMEKFYKLQNECIMESRHKSSSGLGPRDSKSFQKTQKLYTAHTYEMSCDRQLDNGRVKEKSMREYPRDISETKYTDRQRGRERDRQRDRDMYTDRQRETNRKRKVLSEIKSMVRDRRNHLFQ